MGWLTILMPALSTLIDRLFPDKEKQDEAKLEMMRILNQAAAQEAEAQARQMEAQSAVIVAEAQSQSYAARNWRPHLMYCLMATYPVNWILFPILRALGLDIPALPIPSEYWTVLSIGLGGYIGNDMVKNYAQAKFDDKKFFETYRKLKGSLSQEEVDALNKAKSEAQK